VTVEGVVNHSDLSTGLPNFANSRWYASPEADTRFSKYAFLEIAMVL
jgi:hypothetical protein